MFDADQPGAVAVLEHERGEPEAGGDADEVEQDRREGDHPAAEHHEQQHERDDHDRRDGKRRTAQECAGEVGVLGSGAAERRSGGDIVEAVAESVDEIGGLTRVDCGRGGDSHDGPTRVAAGSATMRASTTPVSANASVTTASAWSAGTVAYIGAGAPAPK